MRENVQLPKCPVSGHFVTPNEALCHSWQGMLRPHISRVPGAFGEHMSHAPLRRFPLERMSGGSWNMCGMFLALSVIE